MYQMRTNYPVLQDGMFLQSLSKQTHNIYLPGSSGVATEIGIWSRYRGQFANVQNLSNAGNRGNQSIWLVYQNDNVTVNYQFDCSSTNTSEAFIAPFAAGSTVKNLFYPFEEYVLAKSAVQLGLDGTSGFSGCLQNFTLPAWGFKALVPKASWSGPGPLITKFLPGHDYRLQSSVAPNDSEDVAIEFQFSTEMSCASVASSLTFTSTTESGQVATLKNSTVSCSDIAPAFQASWLGSIPSVYSFKANITNVYNGVHTVTLNNATDANGTATDSRDTFIFRTGQLDNPMIFPRTANYTQSLLHKMSNGSLYVSHKATGADMWRYTLDWVNYSPWMDYTGGNSTLAPLNWTGTKLQRWDGQHVILQYYNRASGSSDYYQHGDLDPEQTPRRFPHLWAEGPFNQYGYDAGVKNQFHLVDNGTWNFNFMTEWPAVFQINGWGLNPDSQPDQTFVYGDADGDSVLDRMPPSSLSETVVNITKPPPSPFLGWNVVVHDSNLQFAIVAYGNQRIQIAIFVIMWLVPILTGALAVWAYVRFFYQVKLNRKGISTKVFDLKRSTENFFRMKLGNDSTSNSSSSESLEMYQDKNAALSTAMVAEESGNATRRNVLIATIEYDIEDWGIKVKIGGLGVMVRFRFAAFCGEVANMMVGSTHEQSPWISESNLGHPMRRWSCLPSCGIGSVHVHYYPGWLLRNPRSVPQTSKHHICAARRSNF